MAVNKTEPLIRPVLEQDEVRLLAERLYGISVLELVELAGYDDRNYHLCENYNIKNPFITAPCPHGYVLKIMNTVDSQDAPLVEAQNEIMTFLGIPFGNTKTITCPKPIRNVNGHLYSLETINGKQHAVRLLEFVPGELLHNVQKTAALLYLVGEFVAHINNKLQNFNHSGVVNREHTWMLTKVPGLEKLLYVIKNQERHDLAQEVIEEFKYAIVPCLNELEKGVIHGDINDMNILVGLKDGSDSENSINGVLDFGDIQYSCYVFDLAIAMTYMIVETGDPRAGGYVYAGYIVNRRLSDKEYRLLKTLISARLVQSLVMGTYTLEQNPTNTYVISTEKSNGWEVLKELRKTSPTEDGDPCDWKGIADQYLTRR